MVERRRRKKKQARPWVIGLSFAFARALAPLLRAVGVDLRLFHTLLELRLTVDTRPTKEGGATPEQRTTWTFRLVTGRSPSAKELPVLTKLLAEQRELFTADAGSAAKLLGVGESKPDASLDANDLAAGTVLALALLNHDAAVMRR